jgi:hypothetical protein
MWFHLYSLFILVYRQICKMMKTWSPAAQGAKEEHQDPPSGIGRPHQARMTKAHHFKSPILMKMEETQSPSFPHVDLVAVWSKGLGEASLGLYWRDNHGILGQAKVVNPHWIPINHLGGARCTIVGSKRTVEPRVNRPYRGFLTSLVSTTTSTFSHKSPPLLSIINTGWHHIVKPSSSLSHRRSL